MHVAQLVLAGSSALLTEMISDGATTSLLMPITVQFAISNGCHPLFFALPVLVGASTSVIFPMGSMALALMNSVTNIGARDMVRLTMAAGLITKLASVSIVVLLVNTKTEQVSPCWSKLKAMDLSRALCFKKLRNAIRLQDIKSPFERLRKRTWTGKDQDDYCCPNGTSFTLCFAAKCLTNCRVFYALEECDLEAARYADKHPECFALLGQDTDFVMFNMRVLYLSTLHLNTRTLTTKAYHPGALAHHLQLAPHQLPLFACLAGNDTVSLDALETFHRSIACSLLVPMDTNHL
ncbi:uncharacterized protein LOC144156445 [Haemaphysalis longicornis]